LKERVIDQQKTPPLALATCPGQGETDSDQGEPRDAILIGTGLVLVRKDVHETECAAKRALESLVKETTARLEQLEAAHREAQLAFNEERERIAHTLHDDLGQQLFVLDLQLRMLNLDTAGASPGLREKTDAMLTSLHNAHMSVRRLVAGLQPQALNEAGLAEKRDD
jgi:signal transduction histidine kinase